MEPQARSGEDVMTGEAGDRGHVVQVCDLVSLRLLHGARLGADLLGEPGLQGLLPVRLPLVPLDPLGLVTLRLSRSLLTSANTFFYSSIPWKLGLLCKQ